MDNKTIIEQFRKSEYANFMKYLDFIEEKTCSNCNANFASYIEKNEKKYYCNKQCKQTKEKNIASN